MTTTGERRVAAVDIGAESGRVVVGDYDGSTIRLHEVHRFPNGPRDVDGTLRWDLARLHEESRDGLAKAAAEFGAIDSVGVDTWGLDYGYLDVAGGVLDDPVSHRDHRTRGMLGAAADVVGRERLFAASGIQLMEINTVFQLLAEQAQAPDRTRAASLLLMFPDLLNHLLSGSRVSELTAASTSGAYDVRAGRWATELLDDLGIPTHMLPEVVEAGTVLGPLLTGSGDPTGLAATRVIAPAGHDTGSAVAGTPLQTPGAAYISSGTWSLAGVEVPDPVVTGAARRANLTNEAGVFGTTRLLRNVMGLWLLQECRRQWEREGQTYRYDDLVGLADREPIGRMLVNPDHPEFVGPGDMPARLRAYCKRTGQPEPQTVAETVRCVLDSLALRYRMAFDDIAEVTGTPIDAVHIVGGGARNMALNQATADICGVPVLAGPVEATALGNLLVQLAALGELDGLGDIRAVVRAGEQPVVVEPRPGDPLVDCYERFTTWVDADLAEILPG